MLRLTDKQFYAYLTIFLMETRVEDSVPDIMYDYIIPNKPLQQFIDEDMIQVWNENVDWDKEREEIVTEITWNVSDNSCQLEDWLTCYGVISYEWETDQEVHVELEDEDMEEEFLQYVQEHFKNVEKDGARSWIYNYKINSYEDEYGNNIKELVYE